MRFIPFSIGFDSLELSVPDFNIEYEEICVGCVLGVRLGRTESTQGTYCQYDKDVLRVRKVRKNFRTIFCGLKSIV